MDQTIVVQSPVLEGVTARVSHVLDSQNASGNMDAQIELEAAITRNIDVAEFMRALKYCMSQGLVMVQQEPNLDISFSNVTLPKGQTSLTGIRLSIIGADHISRYYASGALEQIPSHAIKVVRKTRARGFPQLDIPNYDARVNLRVEESCSMSGFDPKILRTVPKMFRLKARASFLSRDGIFRYDITKVHMSDGMSQHVSSSGMVQSREKYEVEIEMLQPSVLQSAKGLFKKFKAMKPEDIARALLGHIGVLTCAMTESPALLSGSDVGATLRAYEKLVGSTRFGGSQPVTLEKKHLMSGDNLPPNAKSILSGYSVTAKYDGDRHLLFVAPPDGRVMMLARGRNVSNVKYMGFKQPKLIGTMLDGEYLPDDRTYAAFDAYFVEGSDVRDKGLEDRLKSVEKVVDAMRAASPSVEVVAKQFWIADGPEMRLACGELLESIDSGDIAFETDGLIFTPTGPAGQGTIFKWKPAEQNTIDFLVCISSQSEAKTVFTMFCGYRQTRHASITPLDYIKDRGAAAKEALKQSRYVARRFAKGAAVMTVSHVPGDKTPRCSNGDIIDDRAVVECKFDAQRQEWVPMRVRWDKVQEMHATKRITSNNYDTAMSVWETITNPVTVDMISGGHQVSVDDVEYDADVYYNREDGADISASQNMRHFHNWAIKLCVLLGWSVKELSEDGTGKEVSVLDIGCGKGGDIPKYLQLGVRRVLGVDRSVSNIRDVNDGAYARLEELTASHRDKQDLKYFFLNIDASKPFAEKDDALEACITEEDKSAVEILWADQKKTGGGPWSGFATFQKFDIATVMFAIHYFFDKEESMDALLGSLSRFVKKDGHVSTCCLDGQAVSDQLKDSPVLRLDHNGRVVFQIEREYSDEDFAASPYGNNIGVFVESINNVISEPLVHEPELIRKFKQHGFELVRSDGFREVYNAVLEDPGQFAALVPGMAASKVQRAVESVRNMTENERKYSFLHKYYVFENKG